MNVRFVSKDVIGGTWDVKCGAWDMGHGTLDLRLRHNT